MLGPWKESYDKLRQHIKEQSHRFADKGPSSQTKIFPVVMYGCESCAIKELSRRIDALELGVGGDF